MSPVIFDEQGVGMCAHFHDWAIRSIQIAKGTLRLEITDPAIVMENNSLVEIVFRNRHQFCLLSDVLQSSVMELLVFQKFKAAVAKDCFDLDEFYAFTWTRPSLDGQVFFRLDSSVGPWCQGFSDEVLVIPK